MNSKSIFRQSIIYFWLVSSFLFLFLENNGIFESKGVNGMVVLVGNFILFFVSFFALVITKRSFQSENPQAFVRAVYSGFIIKFFVVAISAFVYIMIAKKMVNTPALLFCAGLYIVYTAIETRTLLKMLKPAKHA